MEEQLITLETAKLAKEKGFNIVTECFYNKGSGLKIQSDSLLRLGEDVIEAPTQSLLQKWLRETHNLHVSAFPVFSNRWFPTIRKFNEFTEFKTIYGSPYYPNSSKNTYEEALEYGLKLALKKM